MKIEKIVEIAYKANRLYAKSIKENNPVWLTTSTSIKRGYAKGIKHIINNPGTNAKQNRANWMKDKLAAGWKYGIKRNNKGKIHPCLVPYSELDKKQKIKDYIFLAIVKALI